MDMKKILVFLFLFSSFLLSAQKKVTPEYKKYDWQEEPKLHALSDAEQKEGTVVLKDKRMVEYTYDAEGNLIMYYTRHVIIRLNNDKSIEENNKVYLASRDVVEYMDLKARSVNKAGKVKMVEKE